MTNAYVIVMSIGVLANGFSGLVALIRPRWARERLRDQMSRLRVPASWSGFPIGTLKTAGAIGLLLGVLGVPFVGIAAAIGLVLFWVCALYTHILAGDWSANAALAGGFFLSLAVACVTLSVITF